MNPPPAYSEEDNTSASNADVPSTSESDDPYSFLSIFDTVFLIDDSGSMSWYGLCGWIEARNALKAIAPVCTRYDADGVDIHFLNSESSFQNVKSAERVQQIFDQVRPTGYTPTGRRIHEILSPYVTTFEIAARFARAGPDSTGVKPRILIVITDGVPDKEPDLEGVIRKLARRLDDADAPVHQLGIQFFQVGADRGATEALNRLDDGIEGVRDMVDTVTFDTYAEAYCEVSGQGGRRALTAEGIMKAVLGSVSRRLDRKYLPRA
ncbi:hypothetical protein QBC41DRAFT_220598 [Cercophora samala]|uniref:VWFA domain-containing protein n=1 Tax=Cercophora samala TaxID=330535 RepID=A0AA39ZH60_9PEZI|nr:hypothetical protein QBC41DRAFT_220598 [Cercophora samala]